jgi:hypothetical protein
MPDIAEMSDLAISDRAEMVVMVNSYLLLKRRIALDEPENVDRLVNNWQ